MVFVYITVIFLYNVKLFLLMNVKLPSKRVKVPVCVYIYTSMLLRKKNITQLEHFRTFCSCETQAE